MNHINHFLYNKHRASLFFILITLYIIGIVLTAITKFFIFIIVGIPFIVFMLCLTIYDMKQFNLRLSQLKDGKIH